MDEALEENAMIDVISTIGRGRDALFARGADLARRSTLAGVSFLERVESRTNGVRRSLVTRREGLDGKAIQRLEKRVLVSLELVLAMLGKSAAEQRKRLGAGELPGTEVEDAVVVAEVKADARPRARAKTARQDAPRTRKPAARKPASKAPKVSARAKKDASASTRWVDPPSADVSDLTQLSAKELIARASSLSAKERSALLAHEKANKKRKTVLAALA